MGSFRFCRSCGLDYDSPTPSTPKAPPAILSSLPEASPAEPTSAETGGGPPAPARDVIVIQVAHLKLLAGVIVGGLIGAMLAGAIVVPSFGEDRLLLGSLAAIVTIVVAAGLGLRFAQARARRRLSTGIKTS